MMPTLRLKRCYNFKVKTNLGYLKVQDLARLFTYLRDQVYFGSICIHLLKSYISAVKWIIVIANRLTPFSIQASSDNSL